MKKKNLLMTVIAIFGLATIINAQVPSYVPTSGLVGWWPFNGNANDESGNGNNGTVNGATLSNDRNGNANSAYYFSSSSCATRIDATVNTSSINSAFTISFWMMRVGNGCLNSRIWEFCPGPAGAVPGAFEAYWYNSTNIAGVDQVTSTSTVISTTTNALLDNNWINIIYSNNGLQAKLWVNGSLVDSSTSAGIISLATNFSIGRMGHASYDAFKGNIDDIGLWNRALTQQEITNLYNTINLGINENIQSNLFSVFPNPAQSLINVKADNKLIGEVYTIYDNTGRVVLTGKINSHNTIIELGNLSGGIYMFSVGGNMKQTFKIIKE